MWRSMDSAPLDSTVVDLWFDGRRVIDMRFESGRWVSVRVPNLSLAADAPTFWREPPETPELAQLKACPFCGGEAVLKRYELSQWAVDCGNTDCAVQPHLHQHGGCPDPRGRVIRRWNRRPS